MLKAVFALILCLFTHSAHAALTDCDENEILKRVCNDGGDTIVNTVDDTGVGLTLQQLKINQMLRIRAGGKSAQKTDPAGYERFLKVLTLVRSESVHILDGLNNKYLTNHLINRLQKLRPVSIQENDRYYKLEKEDKSKILRSTPIEKLGELEGAIEWAPTGTYNALAREIHITPAFVNEPTVSLAALIQIAAHELGHHLDQNYLNLDESEFMPKEVLDCQNLNYGPFRGSGEDYADWISSLILERLIKEKKTIIEKKRFAQNSVKWLCDTRTRSLAGHSPSKYRIAWTFRQPSLRAAIGCSDKIIEFQETANRCELVEKPTSFDVFGKVETAH